MEKKFEETEIRSTLFSCITGIIRVRLKFLSFFRSVEWNMHVSLNANATAKQLSPNNTVVLKEIHM